MYLLDNIFIRFGSKLNRQIVGPLSTYCAPLVVDLFLFYNESGFMLSLSDNNQSDVYKALNSTSRYMYLGKAFSKIYQRQTEMIFKYNVGFKTFCIKA